MIRYVSSMVTFAEIPTEVTLSLAISGCLNRCPGCHSPELRKDIGVELSDEILDKLIRDNDGITCVLLLGEGNDPTRLIQLAERVRSNGLAVALYSGRNEIEEELWKKFDYIKIGSWNYKLGPLNQKTTNQRLYKINENERIDITERFWYEK